jgi:hypothetical protein
MALQIVEFCGGHFAGSVSPYALEDVLDGHIAPLKPPGHDRATVEHE